MRLSMWIANGLILAGVSWMVTAGAGQADVHPLVARMPAGIGALEEEAATAPTAPAVSALATAYLDHEQSGLATAVIERAPVVVRERPEIAEIYARALFHRGHARDALAVAEAASEACARATCPGWVVATASKQVAFLGAVVAAGVDDPLLEPDATRAAYERTVREVGLVAVR
jgi:hypothetical protein